MGGRAQKILPVARGVNPPDDCSLTWVSHIVIVGYIFAERSYKEWHLIHPIIEAVMPKWDSALCHVLRVFHCYVVESVVPDQCRLALSLPEVIGKFKSSDA